MSVLFKNRYQTRIVIDDHKTPVAWRHVVLGVYSKADSLPVFFGIPMEYEWGSITLNNIVVDQKHDMHLTTIAFSLLTEENVQQLAHTGYLELSPTESVQLLTAGKRHQTKVVVQVQ